MIWPVVLAIFLILQLFWLLGKKSKLYVTYSTIQKRSLWNRISHKIIVKC